MKQLITIFLLGITLFLASCQESTNSNTTTSTTDPKTPKNIDDFNISGNYDDFAQNIKTGKCYSRPTTAGDYEAQPEDHAMVDGDEYIYIGDTKYVWAEVECPYVAKKLDCYTLTDEECLSRDAQDLSNGCVLFGIDDHLFEFDTENYCFGKKIQKGCYQGGQLLYAINDDNSTFEIDEFNDLTFFKDKETGKTLVVKYVGDKVLEVLDKESFQDFELDLNTYSDMLFYYQNLSMQDATIYTFPKECE
jgi:hypothetical protein